MLEFSILGFLVNRPMTGYEIKQFMEKSTKHFFFSSFGSIYPALRRLEKRNWIESSQKVEHGRSKVIYSINETGKNEFFSWLSSTWSFDKGIEEMLLRIFFGNYLSQDEIKNKLGELSSSLKKRIRDLQALELTLPPDHKDFFENATLKFGTDFYDFTERWLSDFTNSIGKK